MTSEFSAHVLILDDDEGLCHLARRRLERAGYRVSCAQTTSAAQHAIDAAQPDVLVLDYDLKTGQTGLDFFRALSLQGLTLPAILVTGFTDESRVSEALRCGVADLLTKTGDYLDYLPATVTRVVSQQMLKRQLAEAEALYQRELHYRTLAEAIPQLVWTCLPNGECDFLSKQWLAYTGQPEQLQLGHAWLDVLHPNDVEPTLTIWRAAVLGAADYDIEYRLRRHDGQYRWFHARGVAMRDGQGDVLKWFGSCTDIEDRKQAAQEREALLVSERAARSAAERAVRVKDEFVATLSHELRTPLNAIVGWAQFLLRDASDRDKLRKGLEVIDRNAKVQAQMVDDLLDMSRIMSGKLRLNIGEVDLSELVSTVLASVKPTAESKNITLTHSGKALGLIEGDSERLQQVLWNLLMNSIKFTPHEGCIQVVTSCDEHNAEIAITDSGRGIKAEFIAHVFDRFRQEDATTTRKFSGLGLGLAIARQLVELHGGNISAASPGEGLGATFTLHLPLPLPLPASTILSSTKSNRLLPPSDSPSSDDTPRLDGVNILLVGEASEGRDLVMHILEDRGATVTSYHTADEGIAAFAVARPDLVINDMGTPDHDHDEFICRLRQLEDGSAFLTPAAALTAEVQSDDSHRAVPAGFQARLVKPVDPAALVEVVASLAGRNR